MNRFFTSSPLRSVWHGVAILRIITGAFMIYHGWEVFDNAKLNEYAQWDVIKKLPAPYTIVLAGKAMELVGGIFLLLGLFTRIGGIFTVISMLFIVFMVGNGKFYSNDQHPFLLAMLGLLFIFTGPGKWSLDQALFTKKLY